jgi:phosphatidylinositol glycan class F
MCTATYMHPTSFPPTTLPSPNTIMNPAPKVRAPALPIDTLSTDAARLYTHIHPVLVLSLYALRFNATVADPVPALLQTLAPLAVLQVAYVAVCLPPTRSGNPVVDKKKPGEKKRVAEGQVSKKIIVCLPFLFLHSSIYPRSFSDPRSVYLQDKI